MAQALTLGQQKALALARARMRAGRTPTAQETAIDSARSVPGGLAQGGAMLVGGPGSLLGAVDDASDYALDNTIGRLVSPERLAKVQARRQASRDGFLRLPTITDVNTTLSRPFGGYYEPKTPIGRYTETAASLLPAAFGGEASLLARLGTRVAAPALGIQAVGSLVPDSAEPWQHAGHIAAQAAGGLGAGVLAGGARAGVHALRNPPPPEMTAHVLVNRLLKGDTLTPAQVTARAVGRGQTTAEAIGPSGVNNLAALARRPGETGEVLGEHIANRAEGASARMLDDFAKSSGIAPEAARGDFDALVELGQREAKPLYDKALASQAPVMSGRLKQLLRLPHIQTAMSRAIFDLRHDPDGPPFQASGMDLDAKGNHVLYPTALAWDLTKKKLGQMVERDTFGRVVPDGQSDGNSAIHKALVALTPELKRVIPGYANALRRSADYLQIKAAFTAGRDHFLKDGLPASDIDKHFKMLSPIEQTAYKGGQADAMFNLQQRGALKAPKLLTPIRQAKITTTMGPDQAKVFIDNLKLEKGLSETGRLLAPRAGSQTAPLLEAMNEQDRAGNIAGALDLAKAVSHGATGGILPMLAHGASAAKHFFPDIMKTSGMGVEARNAAGRILTMPPEQFEQYMRAYNAKHINLPRKLPPHTLGYYLGKPGRP